MIEAVFATCLVYWLNYFIDGFVQNERRFRGTFDESPTGVNILVIAMVVIRPVTEETFRQERLVNATSRLEAFYAEF